MPVRHLSFAAVAEGVGFQKARNIHSAWIVSVFVQKFAECECSILRRTFDREITVFVAYSFNLSILVLMRSIRMEYKRALDSRQRIFVFTRDVNSEANLWSGECDRRSDDGNCT